MKRGKKRGEITEAKTAEIAEAVGVQDTAPEPKKTALKMTAQIISITKADHGRCVIIARAEASAGEMYDALLAGKVKFTRS